MAIASPTTVRRTLKFVESDRLLLPGIQRSFVWKARQIEQLFDSLMRGYPIGSRRAVLARDLPPVSARTTGTTSAGRRTGYRNLQLLRAEDNRATGKHGRLPKAWMRELTPTQRKRYTSQFVTHVPADLADAPIFWERRTAKLEDAIWSLLVP